MTEERLEQYRALKLEISQLEEKISELVRQGPQETIDSVMSAANFPYSKHTVSIEGLDIEGYIKREERMQRQRVILLEKAQAEAEEIENFIASVPDARLRVIMRYYYIDGLGWLNIAYKFKWRDESVPRQKIKKYLQKTEKTGKPGIQ